MNKRHLRRAALAWAAEELFGATGHGLEMPEDAVEEIARISAELRRRSGVANDARCFSWEQAVEITRRNPVAQEGGK